MIISVAQAASGAAHEAIPFYLDTSFWVSVAFIIVVAVFARPIIRVVKNATAQRAERISKHIDEARQLKDEAQALLAEYERKFKNADEEAKAILDRAYINAEKLKKEAEEKMNLKLARKEEQAFDRIQSAEQNATDEVKNYAIDASTKAAIDIIATKIAPNTGAKMLEDAIKDLPAQLAKKAS